MKKDFLTLFTESPSSLGIDEFKMHFSGSEIEEEYLKETMPHFLSHRRISIIIGVIIFLIFGAVDYLLFPRLKGFIWFIRFAIVIPTFMIVFSLSYIEKFKPHFRKLIPILVLIMSFSHLFSLRYIPFEATSSFYSGYILLIIYSFILMRAGFVYGIIDMSLMAVFYGLFVIFNDNIESLDKIIGVILVLCTCFIGAMYIYLAEYADRKHFIIKKRHKFDEKSFNLADFPFEEAIIFVNKEGNCKYISKQMENLIAHNKETIINNPVAKIFSKKDKKRFEESVRIGHKDEILLEDNFHVLNKSGVAIPLKLTVTEHEDASFGKGYIMIMSNPELEYSSAKLLSNTQQLLKQKTEAEEKTLKQLEENKKAIQKQTESLMLKAKVNPEAQHEVATTVVTQEENSAKPIIPPVQATQNLPRKEDMKKIEELERKLKEYRIKNDALHRDAEALRKENTILKDVKTKEITENSKDSIRLMGRIASFVSSSLSKNFGENINYLKENDFIFKDTASKNYIKIVKNRVYEGLYLSASVAMRFDLFRQYLKEDKEKPKGIEVARNLSSSISQMARYFENTRHVVEIACKDNIMIRMNQDSFKHIFQNLVINGLIAASQLGIDALIEISVKEEKSKVIIDYKDNGKPFPSYYREISQLNKIDSNVLSVNGVEFFFAKELIKRESAGEVSLTVDENGNNFRMIFIK